MQIVQGDNTLDVQMTPGMVQGTLHATSTPSGASAEVDGQAVGTTPLSIPMDPNTFGPYTILIRKNGYLDFSGTFSINAGQTTDVDVQLTPVGGGGGPGLNVSNPRTSVAYRADAWGGLLHASVTFDLSSDQDYIPQLVPPNPVPQPTNTAHAVLTLTDAQGNGVGQGEVYVYIGSIVTGMQSKFCEFDMTWATTANPGIRGQTVNYNLSLSVIVPLSPAINSNVVQKSGNLVVG